MGLSPQRLVLVSHIGLHSWDVWWLHTVCTASQVPRAHMVHICSWVCVHVCVHECARVCVSVHVCACVHT